MSDDLRVTSGTRQARVSSWQQLAVRRLRWIGCAVWAWSWYTMYLEIFRWQHVTRALRFDSTPIPGTTIRPKPGRPLKALFVCFYAAPPLVILSTISETRRRAASGNLGAE